MSDKRTTEAEMSVAVLRILEEFPDGQATIEQIKKRIPDYIMLTEGDLQPSQTRSGEALWEQIVRNIVSHGNVGTAGNIITEGYVEHQPGKLRITDAGRRHLGDWATDQIVPYILA